jgi:hypothetical protein
VLTTKFDILEKTRVSSLSNWNIRFYSYKMVNISKWMSNYIFNKLGHANMFFRSHTYFSDNLVEFHSRNKEVLHTSRR